MTNSRIKIGAGWVEYGALGRNTGEVLDVFGNIVLKDKSLLSGLIGYDSHPRCGFRGKPPPHSEIIPPPNSEN
ncbi:hypothetical protein [Sinorhizobium terangae]|uniref:hypothetical protein n=1 Tax=Sinorhizobium terangae TaxID=110322 RepID=UPI0024B07E50|nr:hypothetical protein [Sinorhizobium terangae]WFU50700.1 hypothetical protein QA637_18835 [Sinorhizobium terangae]